MVSEPTSRQYPARMANCADPLRTRWLYIIGDSSARMLFGALVELVSEQLAAHGIEQAVREAYG